MEDAAILFRWRNDPVTCANFISSEPVSWPEHREWLSKVLRNPARELFIAEEGGAPVGTVRIDDGGKDLSWTVAPEHRGNGVGKRMVALAAKPGHIARIKRSNTASQKVAEYAGFTLVRDGELQEWVMRHGS